MIIWHRPSHALIQLRFNQWFFCASYAQKDSMQQPQRKKHTRTNDEEEEKWKQWHNHQSPDSVAIEPKKHHSIWPLVRIEKVQWHIKPTDITGYLNWFNCPFHFYHHRDERFFFSLWCDYVWIFSWFVGWCCCLFNKIEKKWCDCIGPKASVMKARRMNERTNKKQQRIKHNRFTGQWHHFCFWVNFFFFFNEKDYWAIFDCCYLFLAFFSQLCSNERSLEKAKRFWSGESNQNILWKERYFICDYNEERNKNNNLQSLIACPIWISTIKL